MVSDLFKLGQRQLDQKLRSWKLPRKQETPTGGWIRAIRTNLGLTAVAFAKRLGVTPATVSDLERSEARGTITLNSLRKAGAAIDCTLVYALVPRTTLDEILTRRATQTAEAMLRRVGHSMALEAQAVEPSPAVKRQTKALVEILLNNPKALWK